MKMTYYTSSDQIRDLMKSLADVDVRPTDNAVEGTGLTVYIFDNLFGDMAVSDYRVGRERSAMTFKSLW